MGGRIIYTILSPVEEGWDKMVLDGSPSYVSSLLTILYNHYIKTVHTSECNRGDFKPRLRRVNSHYLKTQFSANTPLPTSSAVLTDAQESNLNQTLNQTHSKTLSKLMEVCEPFGGQKFDS